MTITEILESENGYQLIDAIDQFGTALKQYNENPTITKLVDVCEVLRARVHNLGGSDSTFPVEPLAQNPA